MVINFGLDVLLLHLGCPGRGAPGNASSPETLGRGLGDALGRIRAGASPGGPQRPTAKVDGVRQQQLGASAEPEPDPNQTQTTHCLISQIPGPESQPSCPLRTWVGTATTLAVLALVGLPQRACRLALLLRSTASCSCVLPPGVLLPTLPPPSHPIHPPSRLAGDIACLVPPRPSSFVPLPLDPRRHPSLSPATSPIRPQHLAIAISFLSPGERGSRHILLLPDPSLGSALCGPPEPVGFAKLGALTA
ncbi:hypothetical protein VTN96DRAFT_4950 [Rasamsonia emersonii]